MRSMQWDGGAIYLALRHERLWEHRRQLACLWVGMTWTWQIEVMLERRDGVSEPEQLMVLLMPNCGTSCLQ